VVVEEGSVVEVPRPPHVQVGTGEGSRHGVAAAAGKQSVERTNWWMCGNGERLRREACVLLFMRAKWACVRRMFSAMKRRTAVGVL